MSERERDILRDGCIIYQHFSKKLLRMSESSILPMLEPHWLIALYNTLRTIISETVHTGHSACSSIYGTQPRNNKQRARATIERSFVK